MRNGSRDFLQGAAMEFLEATNAHLQGFVAAMNAIKRNKSPKRFAIGVGEVSNTYQEFKKKMHFFLLVLSFSLSFLRSWALEIQPLQQL